MTRVQQSDREGWWARFDYILDGAAQHTIFARTDEHINDDRFLQYLDQRHAEACAMGAAPVVRRQDKTA